MIENYSITAARCKRLELGSHLDKPCRLVCCYVDPIKEELAAMGPLSIQVLESMLRDKTPAKPRKYPIAPVRVTALASGKSFVGDDLSIMHYRGQAGSYTKITVFVYDVNLDLSDFVDQDVRIDSV